MHTASDEQLRTQSDQIEELLEELEVTLEPVEWYRVEGVLKRLTALYGAGLARMLVHARDTGTGEQFETRLCEDQLLSSLLVLHGLHPQTTAQRIEHAIDSLHDHFSVGPTELALVAIDGPVAVIHAVSPLDDIIRRVIAQVAPEIARVEVNVSH